MTYTTRHDKHIMLIVLKEHEHKKLFFPYFPAMGNPSIDGDVIFEVGCRRTGDGVHWNSDTMRFITNILLTHISLSLDFPLPERVDKKIIDHIKSLAAQVYHIFIGVYILH